MRRRKLPLNMQKSLTRLLLVCKGCISHIMNKHLFFGNAHIFHLTFSMHTLCIVQINMEYSTNSEFKIWRLDKVYFWSFIEHALLF